MKTREQYFEELSQWFRWDPADNKEDYKVELNEQKFRHVVKRYIYEHHDKEAADIEKVFGDTLYKALAFQEMPGINQVLLLAGKVSIEDFVKSYKGGKDERGKFSFIVKSGEEFIKDTEEALKALWEASYTGEGEEGAPDVFSLKPIPPGSSATAIDSLLLGAGNPTFNKILDAFSNVEEKIKESQKAKDDLKKEKDLVIELKDKLKEAMLKSVATVKPVVFESDGTIPEGKMTTVKASELFPEVALTTDYDLPFFEWEGAHPDVPVADPNYIFRPRELGRVLLALVTNRRAYLWGHTGSGKTTLIEQVAARLNWPFARINFDSEITRMDLIGRDTLTHKDGKQVSEFVDGILPRVMSGPYLTCFDEVDFARPDVAYVMQAALEGNPLRITEDGDRVVKPHPYFRMFGTGNTVGQGDEHGMYQGARVQSLAFMNRFNIFCKVPYLNEEERANLLDREHPALEEKHREVLLQYTKEHLEAFEDQKVILPISPRGMLGAALTTLLTGDIKEALETTFLDGANEEDYAVLKGIINRVVK